MALTTYLTQEDVDLCVAFSGQELKEFYSYLIHHNSSSPYAQYADGFNLDKHKSLQDIVLSFCADKTQLFVDKLVKNGEGMGAHAFPVRIEVRAERDIPGASQIATRGIYDKFRAVTLKRFFDNRALSQRPLSIKTSGQMSFEINVKGVDKALPLKYLSKNLNSVLDTMKYKPGEMINAYDAPVIIAADADGTTYGFPTLKSLPTLKESIVFDALIEFLKLGGIYMIVSGNKIERTLMRVVDSVPLELRSNVIVVANGAADMAVVSADGKFDCLEDYRANALKSLEGENKVKDLNVIYIGDDGLIDGNDYPAFECLDLNRSILVCSKDNADQTLVKQCIGGHEEGTLKVLTKVNKDIKAKSGALVLNGGYVSEIIADVS